MVRIFSRLIAAHPTTTHHPMATYDVIVLGVGGVGSAALAHAAARGARVLGIERFSPGHDRGSSHGHTRLIRQAYFEHPDYVPLVQRAFELWRQLEERSGRSLYRETGLLQVGPATGEVIAGVRESARRHSLAIEELSAREATLRFPGFRVPEGCQALFERRAGYLLVESCVTAHATEAARLGAELHSGETVRGWRIVEAGVEVETDRAVYSAERLIVAAGAWAGSLLGALGIRLEVRRKPLYWWQTRDDTYRVDRDCPGYLYDLAEGCFYGFPQIDNRGIKVAEHTGGAIVDDPLAVARDVDPVERGRVAAFVDQYLSAATAEPTDHTVCMYTMSADAHFVVDRHPQHGQVVFAAGLSGHGFKFTCVLGEALVQLALEGRTDLPIAFLSASRPGLRP
jgi:sarcosine oxidase